MELVVLVVLGLGVAVVAGVAQHRRDRRALSAHLEEARAEIRAQLAVMADAILALADRPTGEHPEARRHIAEASAAYQQGLDTVERAATLGQLERVSERVDHARWQLEAATAILDGRPVTGDDGLPAGSCFFDPTHGAGTVVEELRTAAGTRLIRVCSYCAARLDRGEQPAARAIPVGGRSLPAPSAPRHHGGQGLPGLDDFEVRTRSGRTVTFHWVP